MSFQVSPGVETREIDLTNVVPAVSVSIGAIAGHFAWGPVEEIVTVSSEKILADRFGTPTDATFKYFMPAAQFLQYSNTLRVVRTNTDGLLNATADGQGILVKNQSDFETGNFTAGKEFIARFPGSIGNSIGVAVATSPQSFISGDFDELGFSQQFDFAPFSTEFARDRGIRGDELHVVVYDTDGALTGTVGTILETYQGLSQLRDAKKSDGTSNYFVDVINSSSRFVFLGAIDSSLTDGGKSSSQILSEKTPDSDGLVFLETLNESLDFDLLGGSNGDDVPTLGNLQQAYDLFRDSETVDISFIIGVDADADDVTFANSLIALAEERRDAIAFVSPSISRTANNPDAVIDVLAWANGIASSSYGVLDSTALFVFDKFNDTFRFINAAGTVAGLCAFTDQVTDPWFSPAGFNRGQLRGVTRIAFNPNKTDRDDLYKARVNPIVSFPGEGIVLFGDKTALSRPSAFDRINVRRLFIVLQKAISTAAKFQLFELNDEFTRAQFRSLVEPFLRDVQGRRGITDFKLVCDETNNTPEVIDTNRFIADIYIKPARSINFITLNFVAVRTGVEFSEITG